MICDDENIIRTDCTRQVDDSSMAFRRNTDDKLETFTSITGRGIFLSSIKNCCMYFIRSYMSINIQRRVTFSYAKIVAINPGTQVETNNYIERVNLSINSWRRRYFSREKYIIHQNNTPYPGSFC